jgi:nitroreductase
MKKFAKLIIPDYLMPLLSNFHLYFKRKRTYNRFKQMYLNDMLRYLKYSRTFGNDNPDKMVGSIILQYHVIEKGLTMPESRTGFGKERIILLCRECMEYIEKYGKEDEQINHAIGVVLEYEGYHESIGFILDNEVKDAINQLKDSLKTRVNITIQLQKTKTEYFKKTNCSFPDFSNSRSSIRNFTSEDIPLTKIKTALELARNTPSACNRQSWRTYVFTDKQMITRLLEAQGGNRGFGHLTNKLIIVTGELAMFCYTSERYQVYIDGGLYAMNLLYALHNNEIAACILNCSFDFEKEQEIKRFSGIKESEVLIAMIACGLPPEEFKIAISPRYSLIKTNRIIN